MIFVFDPVLSPILWYPPVKQTVGISWDNGDLMGFNGNLMDIASGYDKQFANWNMAIEIVDLPMNSMMIFQFVM